MTAYLSTFLLAVASVGLWTLRVAMTAKGRRLVGSGVAAIEGVTFVAVFSQMVGAVDSPGRVIVYGFGVGTGTYLGLSVDKRLNRSSKPATIKKQENYELTNAQGRESKS